jgi:hypothetical protein
MPLPTFRRDDYLTAGQLNDLVVALKRSAVAIVEGCGLTLEQSEGGTVIGLAQAARQLASIISGPDSVGRYAWQGIYRKPDGTYDDLGVSVSGTTSQDPAYELNGIKAVTPGTRVLLTRSPTTGEWVFTAPPLKLIGLVGTGGIPAMSVTGVSPTSVATPGQGTVTLQVFTGTSYATTSTTLTAYNTTATACVAGHYVQMGVGPGGYIHVDVETC